MPTQPPPRRMKRWSASCWSLAMSNGARWSWTTTSWRASSSSRRTVASWVKWTVKPLSAPRDSRRGSAASLIAPWKRSFPATTSTRKAGAAGDGAEARNDATSPTWIASVVGAARRAGDRRPSRVMVASGHELLEHREVAGVPGLRDDVELAAGLPQHRIVDVLEVHEAEVVLRKHRGDEPVVLVDVDRRPPAPVWTVEGADHRVASEVVDVAGQRARGRLQCRQVLAIAREAVDLPVEPVRYVDAPCPRGDGDAMTSAELAGRRAPAAEREIVPGCPERVVARDPGGEHGVQARVARRHVEETIEERDVRGNEGPAPREVIAHGGQAEVVVSRGRGQRVEELAAERSREDAARVVGGKGQVGGAVGTVPDRRVVEVRTLHLLRGRHEDDLLQVGAHPQDARAGQEEVGLFLAGPMVDGKAAVSRDHDLPGLFRKLGRGEDDAEAERPLTAHPIRSRRDRARSRSRRLLGGERAVMMRVRRQGSRAYQRDQHDGDDAGDGHVSASLVSSDGERDSPPRRPGEQLSDRRRAREGLAPQVGFEPRVSLRRGRR